MVPIANYPIMWSTLISLFWHLEHKNLSSNGWDNFFVPFLATREAVVPLENDPIMSGRLIRLFRHLKHQNLSTGDDFIYSSGIIFLVPFLPTGRQWCYLQIILSCVALWYGHLDSLNIKIRLQTADIFFLFYFYHQGGSGTTCKWSYYVTEIHTVI